MANYNVGEIIENIERVVADQGANGSRSSRETWQRRSLFRKLEDSTFPKLKEYSAVDRVPEGARLGIFKKILARMMRLVSAPQAAYNWNNLQTLQTMAAEIDELRARLESVETGPARPLGMSRLAGAETTRLANLVEQHLAGLHEHVISMSGNLHDVTGNMGRMLDTLGSLSARLTALSGSHRETATDIAAARLDISRLWTEMGLVYESLDTRAEDLWAGISQRDSQLTQNTVGVQRIHSDVSQMANMTKELKARLLALGEQLTLQQEMVENLRGEVGSGYGRPHTRRAPDASEPATTSATPQAPVPAVERTGLDPTPPGESMIQRHLDLAYLRFQRQFRGDEEELRTRQERYLGEVESVLAPRASREAVKLLDVACGDGIFIELAREKGWQARGVDLNDSMVRTGRNRGLDIERGDAMEWLDHSEPAQFDVISCFQFVEHLTPFQLMRYLKGCFRVLRPGGVVLIETINPHTLMALHWYHLDLTHERLVFPEMLSLLAETAGFQEPVWKGINPVSEDKSLRLTGSDAERENLQRLNALLYGDQDYYLLARRPG